MTRDRQAARFRVSALDLVDVLVYVVVLNLAAQYLPGVITESFSVSLLTALLLKIVLELVLLAKKALLARAKQPNSTAVRITGTAGLALLLPGSKLVVLWLEDLIFGDRVELGGFFAVTGLVIALTLCRYGVRLLLDRDPAPVTADEHRSAPTPTEGPDGGPASLGPTSLVHRDF